MHYSRRLALVLAILLLLSLPCAAAQTPKNIILLIGDGMGFGHLTAGYHERMAKGQDYILSTMPVAGFSVTKSANSIVTDSAAGATALSSGMKTNNGTVALTPDGKELKTILEIARDMGKSTGLTTNDRITGATPAGFVAHVKNRGQGEDIAGQIVASRINIAFGKENRYFVPEDGRKDGRDLTVDAKKRGFDVVSTKEAMDKSTSDRILGLFNPLPTLEEMTTKAISVLNRNPKGFFLMVEDTNPDGGGHGNDQAKVILGVLSLDDALKAALAFAKADGNTLVIVTADHETGGMAIKEANEENPVFSSRWTGGGHTGNMVPVLAYGPGSELFAGIMDNTDISKSMAKLWGHKLPNIK